MSIEVGEVTPVKTDEVRVGEHPYILIELKSSDIEGDNTVVNAAITTDGIFNANDEGERAYQLQGILIQLAQSL